MTPDILERIGWAVVLSVLGLALFYGINRLVLRRAFAQARRSALIPQGRPAILYFTTPNCAPCRTIQRPAIYQLQELLGDKLKVLEVDASAQPELASQWGVMSVPTTFIIDAQGQPRHVNHGVATIDRLLDQLRSIS